MRKDLERWIAGAWRGPPFFFFLFLERRDGFDLVLHDASTIGWGAVLYDERNGKVAATEGNG